MELSLARSSAATAAAALAVLTLVPVASRQLGIVERLPDPPGDLFDSERIVMSRSAHPCGIPDGILGLASYGATLALLLLARDRAWARPALAAKLSIDASVAGVNALRQVATFRKVCSWCMATVLCTVAMRLLTLQAREP